MGSESSPACRVDAAVERRWIRSGDADALAALHRRYRVRLEAVAYRVVGSRADAEDVVQRVFQALPGAQYRGAASLWTYLYRAVLNGSVNLLRSRRRREAAEAGLLGEALLRSDAGWESPESHLLEGELMAALAKGLLRVRERHRRVLVLRVVWGYTNTEIAQREGVPPATVGTWLRRGRNELRRALEPVLRDLGCEDV